MEKDNKDIGFIEDAIFYLQNGIAAENHAIESFVLTKDKTFMDVADIIRRKRSKILYHLVPEGKGQAYCLAKHLLACAMALKELGNRFIEKKDKKLASECFFDALDYEAMFVLFTKDNAKEVQNGSFLEKTESSPSYS